MADLRVFILDYWFIRGGDSRRQRHEEEAVIGRLLDEPETTVSLDLFRYLDGLRDPLLEAYRTYESGHAIASVTQAQVLCLAGLYRELHPLDSNSKKRRCDVDNLELRGCELAELREAAVARLATAVQDRSVQADLLRGYSLKGFTHLTLRWLSKDDLRRVRGFNVGGLVSE